MNHGWIIPNLNGFKARCGGPGICPQCQMELQSMQKPTVGRIVHYTLPDGPSAGQVRPAIIVRTWEQEGQKPEEILVQLQVFTDGTNDGLDNVVWKTSVHQSETPEPGKFCFPQIVR